MATQNKTEENRLWGRLIKGQKILRQETVPCDPEDLQPALDVLCRALDLPRPLWLQKHTREIAEFGHTSFRADHFMEPIAFSRLEIELIQPEEKRKKTRDPRIEA